MIVNCLNCGATLGRDGLCGYCGTKVVPNLMIFAGDMFDYSHHTELNINVADPHGNIFTIPLEGHIDSVEMRTGPFEDTEV